MLHFNSTIDTANSKSTLYLIFVSNLKASNDAKKGRRGNQPWCIKIHFIV